MAGRAKVVKEKLDLQGMLTEGTVDAWLIATDTRLREAINDPRTPVREQLAIHALLKARKAELQGDGTPTVIMSRLAASQCVQIASGLPPAVVTGGQCPVILQQLFRRYLKQAQKPKDTK